MNTMSNVVAEAGLNQIPVGYKQTEVGVIPEDWEVAKIAEKHVIATGSTPPTSNLKNYGETYLFVSPADLSDKKYILQTEKKLSEQGFTISRKYPAGSTLFTCIGSTIGKTGLALIKLTSNQQINAIFPNDDNDAEFTYYAITYIAPKIKVLAGQQAVPLVNKTEFGETIFCFPRDKHEQTAIANALSDIDALITELEKLIAKKQAIKTATMQQLLTGRTRLPQFALREDGSQKGTKQSELGEIPEDWEICALGDIGQTFIGLTYSPNDVADFGTLVLRSSNVQNGKLAYVDNVYVNMELSERVIVKKGDILVCVRNGSRQLIGKCALIDKNAEGSAFGAFMSIFRTRYSVFVFYQFQSDLIQKQINEIMGATINQITNKDMFGFKIILPDEKEQTAIAAILSDMDEEIQALEQRLNKTCQIKQGMMQELLTGRTRLV